MKDALVLHKQTWAISRWFDLDNNPIDKTKYKILAIIELVK